MEPLRHGLTGQIENFGKIARAKVGFAFDAAEAGNGDFRYGARQTDAARAKRTGTVERSRVAFAVMPSDPCIPAIARETDIVTKLLTTSPVLTTTGT